MCGERCALPTRKCPPRLRHHVRLCTPLRPRFRYHEQRHTVRNTGGTRTYPPRQRLTRARLLVFHDGCSFPLDPQGNRFCTLSFWSSARAYDITYNSYIVCDIVVREIF